MSTILSFVGASRNGASRHNGRSHTTRQTPPAAPPPWIIIVRFGDRTIQMDASHIASDPSFARLVQVCEQHHGDFSVQIDLLALADEHRLTLFAVMRRFHGRCWYAVEGEIGVSHFLFDVALGVLGGNLPLHEQGRMRQAATEAAALEYPKNLEGAATRLARCLNAAGVRGNLIQPLVKQMREVIGGEGQGRITADAAAKQVMQYFSARAAHESIVDAEQAEEAAALRYFRGDFYSYSGKVWQQIDSDFRARLARVLQDLDHGTSITTTFLADLIVQLQGMTLLEATDSPTALWLEGDGSAPVRSPFLAFANGLVHMPQLLAGEVNFRPHDSRHFSTVVLPYDFDEQAGCPLWLSTLRGIFRPRRRRRNLLVGSRVPHVRDRRIEVLQEFVGYVLMQGDFSHEKFLVMFGKGSNGKTTILKLLESLFGEANLSHVPLEAFASEFRLHDMAGKIANISFDMNRIDRVAEGVLKGFISGEPHQVNRKYHEPYSMRPTAKLIFATNELPPFNDRSDGIWRRLIAMPFSRQFAEEEKDLQRADRLKGELPGIFNWAIEGARRLTRQGHFTHCDVCAAALAEHRQDSDPVSQFVDECIEPQASQQARTTVGAPCGEVYACYAAWCIANGRRPASNTVFGKQLQQHVRCARDRDGQGVRTYRYRGVYLSLQGRLLLRHRQQ